MMRLVGLLFLSYACGETVTPTQKVIQLLVDMKASGQKLKNDEQVEFAKFKQFCDDTTTNKDAEIKKENQLIESLSAEVMELKSNIKALTGKIAELHTLIENSEASLKEAKSQRELDHASYTEQIEDFGESADALERAVAVLKKQDFSRKQAAEALLQLSTSASIPETAQRALTGFIEMSVDPEPRMPSEGEVDDPRYIERDAPEAAAYEFQSSSILDLLEKLRVEFTEKHTDAQKEEMNSKHAHQMVVQDLSDTIEGAKSDIADKTMDLQEKKKLLATKSHQLAEVTADRDEGVKFLAELRAECSEKSASYEEKQELRVGELQAIDKAIEILGSAAVAGAADTHLPASFMQMTSLAHLRSDSDSFVPIRNQLAMYLKGEGQRLHSEKITMLAEAVASNPFAKVKKLIKDLIENLLNEINEETEQKGFCDTELGTNKIQRRKLGDTIDELTAKIDEGKAFVTKTTEHLATLASEIAEVTTQMKDATELRQEEKKKNDATIKDAIEAQSAVSSAKKVLEEFYEKAGTATAFVQLSKSNVPMGSDEWNSLANPNADPVDRGHKKGMQTFGDTYTGQQDQAGGVLAMLEVISSDFARLETETNVAESQSLAAYDDFMANSKKSVAVKSKETEMNTHDRDAAVADLATDKKDLAETQDQMLAADRYYEKLKPTCVDTGISYSERSKARQEEIQSLQEALQILKGYTIA